jgi:hypothetical protein
MKLERATAASTTRVMRAAPNPPAGCPLGADRRRRLLLERARPKLEGLGRHRHAEGAELLRARDDGGALEQVLGDLLDAARLRG